MTDEQRSIAWCPEPPREHDGGHDCRLGGSCGLDITDRSRRALWVRARYWWFREQRGAQ